MTPINIEDKLRIINDYWTPKIIAELNNQHVKLVKFKGEFIWHKHEKEDEMFYVISGNFNMEFRDRTEKVNENEFIIVPKGVEHRPVAEQEVSVMLFEPTTTINTGKINHDLTHKKLDSI
jgi:mannose-6-phosphate isomerase-like protein (cupin superfamily)